MSMLRYVRIHTLAPGVQPSTSPSPSASKLYRTFAAWLDPLYAYGVPHRRPSETTSSTCRCRYPLFTFCSPTSSPFNDVRSEPSLTVPAVGASPPVLTSTPEVTSPMPSLDSSSSCANQTATTGLLPVSPHEPTHTAVRDCDGGGQPLPTGDRHGKLIQASMEAVGHRKHTTTTTHRPPSTNDTAMTGQVAFADASTTAGAGRPHRRRFFTWGGGGARGGPGGGAIATLPSNVIPNHPPAYRCEVCDYLQNTAAKDTADAGPAAHSGETVTASEVVDPAADHEGELDEEADEADDDWDGAPASTDIANTIMEDTEVAQLRFQDPFLVEVVGKVGLTRLANTFRKEFQGQLARCQLSAAELSRRVSFVPLHNRAHERAYAVWVEGERQRERDSRKARSAQTHSSGGGVVPYAGVPMGTLDLAAYAVRFAVAAYGLPFELGYFNNISEMAKLQAEPHRRYTYATSEEQLESMRRMLQGEIPNALLEFAASHYNITPNRACYTVVLDHQCHRVVVAFRGSLTLADAICDVREGYVQVDLTNTEHVVAVGVERGVLRAVQPLRTVASGGVTGTQGGVTPPPLPPHTKGSVPSSRALLPPRLYQKLITPQEKLVAPPHRADVNEATCPPLLTRIPFGFYEAVTDAARSLIPTLRSIHAQYPDYELVLTGHSLGGIEATLFHLLFCVPTTSTSPVPTFRRVQTATFGAAPVVEECTLPQLQDILAGEEARSGSRLVHFSYGLDAISRLQVRTVVDLFQPLHSSASAGKGAQPIPLITLVDDTLPTLTLPGHLYSIPHTRCRSCYAVGDQCGWRKELVVSPESVFHHFPTFYLRAVNRLYRAREASTQARRHRQTSFAIAG